MRKPKIVGNGAKWPILVAMVAMAAMSGCSSPRALTGMIAGAGGGAALGSELSGGNIGVTAGSAVTGALAGALAGGGDAEAKRKGFEMGYDKGQSDAIKRHYFMLQAAQREPENPDRVRRSYITLPGPEVGPDGEPLEDHRITVPIVRAEPHRGG